MLTLKLYNTYAIDFFGHKYSMCEISHRWALFSGKYNHFLDFELVNVGFDVKDIYKLHEDGKVTGENYLCYDNVKDAELFVEKLIVELVNNHSDFIEVIVPRSNGAIIKDFVKKYNLTTKKLSNGSNMLCKNGSKTEEHTNINVYRDVNIDIEQPTLLDIRINKKHKLNIDFKE